VVRQIRNAPQTVQNVVTYDAVIDVANKALELRPGMTANVTFVYAERPNALKIPNAALRFRLPPELLGRQPAPTGGAVAAIVKRAGADRPERRTVWVWRGKKPQPISIRVGISDGTQSEVVDGDLEEGDAVITDLASRPAAATSGALRRGL
jgi:HlyD family secretion protein